MVTQTIKKANPTEAKEMLFAFIKNANEGRPLYEVCGLTKSHIESIYQNAFNLYSNEKYEEANQSFQLMALYDHLDQRAWMGLGLTFEKLKQYNQAINSYASAHVLDLSNPTTILHAVNCYVALGNYQQATKALEAAVTLAKMDPNYANIGKSSEKLLQHLKTAQKS